MDSVSYAAAAKAGREADKARHAAAADLARNILQATIAVNSIPLELRKCETAIATWCARMAWPGSFPTPPYEAWERRKVLRSRLAEARTYLEIARP